MQVMLLFVVHSSSSEMYTATITGQAFLRNQVRCMMAVLFLVGNRLESPEVSKLSEPHPLSSTQMLCR